MASVNDGPALMFGRTKAPGWPVVLTGLTPRGVEVRLRPPRVQDAAEVLAVRRASAQWLAPWDATSPTPTQPRTFEELVRESLIQARQGSALPFIIEVGGHPVGQLNLSNIVRGAFQSCSAGYWVSRHVAGRGIMPTALALAGDHAFGPVGLHRLEVNIRPENEPSLAVVRKLGFRDEGTRLQMLHIAGAWRDHRSFALTADEVGPQGLIGRLHSNITSHIGDTPTDLRGEGRSQP